MVCVKNETGHAIYAKFESVRVDSNPLWSQSMIIPSGKEIHQPGTDYTVTIVVTENGSAYVLGQQTVFYTWTIKSEEYDAALELKIPYKVV